MKPDERKPAGAESLGTGSTGTPEADARAAYWAKLAAAGIKRKELPGPMLFVRGPAVQRSPEGPAPKLPEPEGTGRPENLEAVDDEPPPIHDDEGLQDEQDEFDEEVGEMTDEERFQRVLALMDGREYVPTEKSEPVKRRGRARGS
jgi:hypothetical protein